MIINKIWNNLYFAKVRFLVLFGSAIWGCCRIYRFGKNKSKSLHILTRVHNKIKFEIMLRFTGLHPIWVYVITQIFRFLILILEYGDKLELVAWEYWKASCRQQGRDWIYVGGRDCLLECSIAQAKVWFPIFQIRWEKIIE